MSAFLTRTRSNKSLLQSAAALAAALSCAAVDAAEVARVEGFGPVSRGMAGGGVAYPLGAASMMLNPAELLSMESEQELMFQFTAINAKIEVENRDTGEYMRNNAVANNRGPYFLPELAWAARRGDWAFGVGVFGAGGFGVEYGTQSFLSRTTTNSVETGLEASTRAQLLRIPLALAWRPASRLRIGASLDVMKSSVNLSSLLDVQQVGMLIQSGRATGTLVPALGSIPNLSGAHFGFVRDNPMDSQLAAWGYAGRIGISFDLTSQTTLAVAYDFESRLGDLKGDGRLTAVDASNNQFVIPGKGRLPEFQFPQVVVLGASRRVTPNFAYTADVRRTFWRQVLEDTVVGFRSADGGTLNVSLPTGFNNLTVLTAGLEWRTQPKIVLRAGASHALQHAVPNENLSGAFPTISRNHVTGGVSYRPTIAHQLDFSFSCGFTDTIRNPGGNVNSLPVLTADNHQFNPAFSYSYRF